VKLGYWRGCGAGGKKKTPGGNPGVLRRLSFIERIALDDSVT
jgi:hypothetical protein